MFKLLPNNIQIALIYSTMALIIITIVICIDIYVDYRVIETILDKGQMHLWSDYYELHPLILFVDSDLARTLHKLLYRSFSPAL